MDSINHLFGLDSKVAVVIGGTGELCGAMAEGLAAAGAEVVLVGRSEAKAKARIERIESAGGKVWFSSCEVDVKANLESLLATILGRSGKVDILVNGAGINSPTPFFDIPEDEWDRIFQVNLKAVFLACQVFGQYMSEREELANIINIGSMSAIKGLSKVFTYSATKAAVHNLSQNLAREWATRGVRVNTLVPGFFPAEQNKKVLTEERVSQIMGHTPMKRFGRAEELVGATLLLASEGAGSFMTGTEIVVDGGFAAMMI